MLALVFPPIAATRNHPAAARRTLCLPGRSRSGAVVRPRILRLLWGMMVLGAAGSAPWNCRTEPARAANLAEMLNARIAMPYDNTQMVAVNFVSNRQVTGEAPDCSDGYYSVELGPKRHGLCLVNVPRAHEVGSIDATGGDPQRHEHFIVTRHQPLAEADFYATLDKDPSDILVFVHGFNVKFREAVLRSAQIAYDAKFQGSVVLFSWPAGARPGFLASLRMDLTYRENRDRAAQSVAAMRETLERLAATKRRIHVVVHSMGHQVVIPAAAALADSGAKQIMHELVFTAPDFAEAEFRALAPKLRQVARRITLYCSPADNALRVSVRVNENKRVGQCSRIDGMDVINVNLIDSPLFWVGGLGHGYYSSRAILTDLFQLLLGIEARRRLFIRVQEEGDEHYVLRK